jgi:hypothetical protein
MLAHKQLPKGVRAVLEEYGGSQTTEVNASKPVPQQNGLILEWLHPTCAFSDARFSKRFETKKERPRAARP